MATSRCVVGGSQEKYYVWIIHVAALLRETTAPNWNSTAFHVLDQSSDEGGQYMW